MTYRIVVIDDERVPAPVADGISMMLHRTIDEGLAALREMHVAGEHLDELWLDHDLGINEAKFEAREPWPFDDIMPVVTWLEEQGHAGTPLRVDYVFVHTMNVAAVPVILNALRPYYNVSRAMLPVTHEPA